MITDNDDSKLKAVILKMPPRTTELLFNQASQPAFMMADNSDSEIRISLAGKLVERCISLGDQADANAFFAAFEVMKTFHLDSSFSEKVRYIVYGHHHHIN